MIDSDGRATLKIPEDLALKLQEKAKDMKIDGRAPWAIYARMKLREAVEDGD